MLYRHAQHHNDTINKQTQETSLTKYVPLTLFVRVQKGYSRFACERELEIEHNCNILTPTFMAVNVVSFSFSWCSTGGPGVHSAGCWLSLLHLISIFSRPQLIRAPSPFGLVWFSLPLLIYLPLRLQRYWNSNCPWLPSWLRYIIIQRPLDLWNRMFNRHQAEIIVMQFTGHSLPVHQSKSVPWEFLSSSHFISQFPPTRFPLITAIGMCHFLPVHHLEWHFGPGRRSKYNTNKQNLGKHQNYSK